MWRLQKYCVHVESEDGCVTTLAGQVRPVPTGYALTLRR